jgi:hypothetical protein
MPTTASDSRLAIGRSPRHDFERGATAIVSAARRNLAAAWTSNPPLTVVGLAMGLALLGFVVGLLVDPTVITGAPAWLKPSKFAVSIAIYSFTLVWLLSFIRGHRRLVAAISWGVAAGFALELALIALQAARGTTSHFNVATPFDAAVFGTMAVAIVFVWLLNAVAAVLLLRQRFLDPVLGWALRFGLLIALVGMALGFMMTRPTPAQEAAADAGGAMPIAGAHAVGVPDGGPGLPVVGWSAVGGDLRVAHFVGLHALQALPLAAWLIGRFAPAWLSTRRRVALVQIAGVGWLGLTLLLAWQARRGQPLIAPDGQTATAFALLLALVVAATLAVLRRPRGPVAAAG